MAGGRILHVIRHPLKVVASHYQHAWYKTLQFRKCDRGLQTCNISSEPTEFSAAETELVSAHLSGLGGTVCELMANVTAAMRSLQLGTATQVVRYEDLAMPYTHTTFNAILGFLGILGLFPANVSSGLAAPSSVSPRVLHTYPTCATAPACAAHLPHECHRARVCCSDQTTSDLS